MGRPPETPLELPTNLAAAARREGRDGWLALLPRLVDEATDRWSLSLAPPFQPGGVTAWVAPARDATGRDLVVKLVWPHEDAAHEAAGLRAWDGHGAVRLHDAARLDGAEALLLERCRPGDALSARPEPEQDVVVADVLRRLWRAPVANVDRGGADGDGGRGGGGCGDGAGSRSGTSLDNDDAERDRGAGADCSASFPTLGAMCARWADEFDAHMAAGRCPLDPGLARAGIALYRELPATADRRVLLATDLHAGNVLAAGRSPWLAIDPKPHVGDPTYDAVQHILNCDERLHADPTALCDRMADLLDLDAHRLRLWVFARCVQESPEWPGLAEVAPRLAP